MKEQKAVLFYIYYIYILILVLKIYSLVFLLPVSLPSHNPCFSPGFILIKKSGVKIPAFDVNCCKTVSPLLIICVSSLIFVAGDLGFLFSPAHVIWIILLMT